MIELVLSLIPITIAAALQPPQVIALVILLLTRRGIVNALAFIAGMTAFRLLLGGTFWLLISPVEETIEGSGGDFDLFVGSVLVVLAFLMLAYALRRGLSAEGEDRAAASWMEKLDAVSPSSAALLGVAFLALDPKDWIIDLSAVNLIADADLSGTSSIVAYLAYIVMAQSLLWIPLILMLVVPSKARHVLVALNTWMKRHERSIEIIVTLVFGVLFLYLGLEQLGIFWG